MWRCRRKLRKDRAPRPDWYGEEKVCGFPYEVAQRGLVGVDAGFGFDRRDGQIKFDTESDESQTANDLDGRAVIFDGARNSADTQCREECNGAITQDGTDAAQGPRRTLVRSRAGCTARSPAQPARRRDADHEADGMIVGSG